MDAYYDDGNNNDNDVDDDDEYDLEDLTAVSSPSVVRVYQPILYGTPSTLRTGSSTGNSHYNYNYSNNNTSNTGSFIGGAHSDTAETCAICQSVLFPLVNYYHYHSDAAVEDCDYEYTILRVSACNRPSCYRTLFPNVEEITKSDESVTVSASSIATTTPSLTVVRNALHYGGNGVVVARRIPVHRHSNDNNNNDTPSQQQPTSKATSSGNEWTADIDDLTSTSVNAATSDRNIDQNDDKDENDGDLDFDALESQLNAIEARGASLLSAVKPLNKTNQRNHRNNNPSTGTRTSSRPPEPLNGFPKFMLHGRPEPPVVHSTAVQQDMDDVGLSGRNNNKNDQKKIQQMLQQYMEQMEDDVDLLNLLQQQQQQQHPIGNTNTGGSRHNNNHHSIQNHTERDERLSVMDRALFTYTDRLKRVPRQVVRYGGAAPLWSMYVYMHTQSEEIELLGDVLTDFVLLLISSTPIRLTDRSCHSNNSSNNIHQNTHRNKSRPVVRYPSRRKTNRTKFTVMNNQYRPAVRVVHGYVSNCNYYHPYCMF